MRILHLTSHLNVGGITTVVVSLSEALHRRGHQVMVASGGGALVSGFEGQGIPHWRVPLNTSAEISPQVAWTCRQLSRKLSAQPVDVIHAHTRVAQVAAEWLSRRHRIPYVTTWHGFFRRRLTRRLCPCTGRLTIAISEPVAAHLREDFGLAPERIRLIPHGVDVSKFSEPMDAHELRQLRAHLRLEPDAPVVGTIARLVPSKGIEQLVEAFREVRARNPRTHLLIVGDGKARPALERLSRKLGLAESVRFAGMLPDTRAALAVMDVFVFMPAIQEGFGLVLLEAMASRRPIVAIQRGGGASWVLDEAQAALVVEPGEPQRLGEALVRVLNDPAYGRQLADEAYAIVKSRYDLESRVTQVEQVYREVLVKRDA